MDAHNKTIAVGAKDGQRNLAIGGVCQSYGEARQWGDPGGKPMQAEEAKPKATERAGVITVHGTGDSQPGPDGAKWWQRGSEFSGWLIEELAARGVAADIHPLIWSGANSATAREEAARALAKKLRQLAKEYDSLHVIGHSHGGNVADEAAAMMAWNGGAPASRTRWGWLKRLMFEPQHLLDTRASFRLRSISTVGTPFFRSGVSLAEGVGARAFFAMALFSTALVAVLIAAPKSLLERLDRGSFVNSVQEAEAIKGVIATWLTGVGVAGLVALIFIVPIAWRGLMRIRRAGRRRPKAGLFSIWHPLDEAISFLQRVEALPIEPFARGSLWRGSRTGGVLWGVRAVFMLPVLGLIALAADWGLERYLDQTPEFPPYGFGPAPLEAIAQQMILFGVAGSPVIFVAVYLLYRTFAFIGLEQLGRGPLNRAVGGAMKGIAFGRDGDHNPGNVSSRSHRFGTKPLVLDGELAERLRADSMETRLALFGKYESGVFAVDADQNEVVREIAEDAMTWEALIHTTYFDHREIADVIADQVKERLEADGASTDLIAPLKRHEGESWLSGVARVLRGWALGLTGLAASLIALMGAVAFLALRAVPIANNDHLAEERRLILPPAPYLNGQVIAKGRDCEGCPELVVLPGGTYSMGSPTDEPGRFPNEGPMRRLTVAPFAVGKYEVTVAEWEACVANGGCERASHTPSYQDEDRGRHPATLVSWNDAQDYVAWLNSKVEGSPYRLLWEHEWEYAARAGTTTAYWWGRQARPDYANFGFIVGRTAPVGAYPANPFGLHDMHGNVSEWVEDCYRRNPGPPPVNSSDTSDTECFRLTRGGSWLRGLQDLRSAFRGRSGPKVRDGGKGFRVARSLEPAE
ncbi:MAG: SUMF1/EgtB/PvdO family nonheme iron enzyme [Alphaproteobacteria bacterium]|nr:SUMF1/EgtB/PvdO family nonheme iron enzyme [Alphaproteobacteria bacterium]